jgi:multiple sugar transport system substrate-binding protein
VAGALEFIVWAMRQAALRGNPPTRRSLFLDPDLRRRFRSWPAQLASLESARPRPRTPRWNEIENTFGVYLSQANSGKLSPQEALWRTGREIGRILERSQ